MPADYCQLAKELVKILKKGKENGLIELAYDELEGGDIEAAIELFKERAGLSIRHKEKYAEGLANLGLGACYLCQAGAAGSDSRKADKSFNSALRAFQGHDSKGEITALIALGIAAEASGDLKGALDKYYLAKRQIPEKEFSDEDADLHEIIHTRIRKAGEHLSESPKRKTSQEKEPPDAEPPPTPFPEDSSFLEQPKLHRIPILGEVAAGPLMLAEENIEGYIVVDGNCSGYFC